MERRLAAILVADVVGYSRLIRSDEEGTLAALKTLRTDFIDPKIAQHQGRVVKLMGDGMLAEFPSVVDAVRAAIETQRAVTEHNSALPEDRRIEFRIGINLGDVVVDDDDIQGDGVNVAARLEGLSEPGGICISGKVYEEVRDRVDLAFEDLGEREVTNIDRPVRVWRWPAEERLAAKGADDKPAPAPKQGKRFLVLAAASAAAFIAIAASVWWITSEPSLPPMLTAAGIPTHDPVLAAPTGPAIAVLPFDNLSEERGQDFFADGLTEDIITGLSRFNNLRVIARNSTFQYKGRAIDVRDVGKALGVRYVLEGSVRRSGNSLRVSAQLLDARDGTHLWAENYSRDLTTANIFALQDSIMERIVGIVGGGVGIISRAGLEETAARHTDNLTAYECVLRAYGYDAINVVLANVADGSLSTFRLIDLTACSQGSSRPKAGKADPRLG